MPACHPRHSLIRALFDEYAALYLARDERLLEHFSDNFSGYTGCGDTLVRDKESWLQITRLDFSQVAAPIHGEMLDLELQDLAEDVVAAIAFFHIHLPAPHNNPLLSDDIARLVLIFRREGERWKVAHSGISLPYHFDTQGSEIYPLQDLRVRSQLLENMVEERTRELETANRRLEALSNTDGLTGIANRRHFDKVLQEEWNRALRHGKALALVMLDVDRFKDYNDRYGHLAGDLCLKALAGALQRCTRRAGELAARYGGEEFVILLPDASRVRAVHIAQHVQREIAALGLPHETMPTGQVTVSLGVTSMHPAQHKLPEELLLRADGALYQAKQNGRNRLECAS